MSTLTLSFLGTFEITYDGMPVTRFRSDKVRALLAFLATAADRPHTRTSLAALLWPEQGDEAALRNLSQTLLRLRTALGDTAAESPLLSITRAAIQWRSASASSDVADFVRLTRSADPDDLAQAIAFYRGEFLEGFGVQDCEPFEEWLRHTREQFQAQALAALYTLASYYLAHGRWPEAIETAHRQIVLDPWRETAHRQLMQALAESGDRAAALAQFARCRTLLADELGVDPSDETMLLYRQIQAGALEHLPVVALAQYNVPRPPTKLIGRASDLEQIGTLLADTTCRLVTLVGPGGIGKTHLALQAAADVRASFVDGVYFINLAPIGDPELVMSRIAQMLPLQEHMDQPLFERLQGFLGQKHLLLVLDNFEQVAAAASQLAELLACCPDLTMLVTSRAVLHLRGEHEIALNPLALPARTPMQGAHAAAVEQVPAVALFVQRAQAILPTFRLTQENVDAVVEICRRLDGLPLAIELAAARIKLLPPQVLVKRLGSSLTLLSGGMQDLPARQQTLRQTLDWSYDLLRVHEQTLFRRLAVFLGGWTIDSVEGVCSVVDGLRIDVLDGLAALIDQSLVQQATGTDGEARFVMLETIHDYGWEQLEASGEASAIRQQHAAYYLMVAEAALPELEGGSQQIAWFQRLDAELDNLRVAFQWAMEHGQAEFALRLGTALREFWMTRAHLSEGRRWLEAALEAAKVVPHAVEATLMVRALTTAGWLAANQRDYSVAEVLLDQSLALARQLGDTRRIIAVLGDLGQATRLRGDLQRAVELYEESVALSREIGERHSSAWALCNLGIIAHAERDDLRAAALLEEGATLARDVGDKVCVAWCLTFLARIANDRGTTAQSIAIFAETLELFRNLGHLDGLAFTVEGCAALAAAQGEMLGAARLFGAAEALRTAINRPQPLYERDVPAANSANDDEAWQAAWAEGQAMTLEQVFEYSATLMPSDRTAHLATTA